MSKINNICFISTIKCINLIIAWINAVYRASVVLKAVYVYNLQRHNTGHSTYVITYTEHEMTFYALLASA